MPAWRLTALSSVLALTTAGCGMVGPDFSRPASPDDDHYVAEPLTTDSVSSEANQQHITFGPEVPSQWWHAFQSPELDDLVQHALAGNRSLASAEASLRRTQELVNAQAGTLDPQVGIGGGLGRQKLGAASFGSDFALPPFTYFAIGPTVSYTLDYTGGGRRSVEQARANAEYLQHRLDAARLAVMGNTLREAVQVATLRSQIKTVEDLLDRDKENLRLVQVAFQAGSVARLDIVSAQAQLAADETLLPTLHQQLSVAQHALAVLAGNTPASGAGQTKLDLSSLTLPTDIMVTVPSELARHRPDILAAEAQLHASTAAVGVAEANLYPRITISASGGVQSSQFSHLFDGGSSVFGLGAGLVAPLFDGGTLRAERRAAIEDMQASTADYQQVVLEAFQQVADSLQALHHDADEQQARDNALDSAQEEVDLARHSYQEGNAGVLQVLDAQRRYEQARLAYVQVQGQRLLDTVQLYLAIGSR
jgi:NodT family efflux transporter outer membrane factor (OMF) lipoprotein